jgi:N,N'-diacetyllegionaminate synthase
MRRTFIIAEAGVNHNGSLALAKKMIDVAADSGADAIKFQTFKAEELVSANAPKAEYQRRATGKNGSQFDMLKGLELDSRAHEELVRHCRKQRIMFLSTAFDFPSLDLLCRLGLKIFKISSGEITNLPFLRKVGRLRKKVILSTGMAVLKEVKDALDILIEAGTLKDDITLLHCHTEYPTAFEDVNLRAMLTMRDYFKVNVGLSDHTPGIVIPVGAVALGATVIEKHFTMDKQMKGPDHNASLEPPELKAMVTAIRNIETALGDGIKRPTPAERKNSAVARRSIVAAIAIKAGEKFTEKNLSVKRPARGLSPMRWDAIIGKTAKRDFQKDEPIKV